MNRSTTLALVLLFVLFVILRLAGLSLPYHQDEWKNVSASETLESAGAFFAHPPLQSLLFVSSRNIFGIDGMRLMPFVFSLLSAILLFVVLGRRSSQHSALWALGLLTVCIYGVWGSLSVDVDGSILPFLFLLAVFFYDSFGISLPENKWKCFIFIIAVLFLGMMVKLSFVIVPGTLLIDWLWNNRKDIKSKQGSFVLIGGIVFVSVYVGLLYSIQAILPSFNIDFMLGHAKQFAGDGRSYLQIVVQSMKAIYYLSPLLLVPLVLIYKETLKRNSIFVIYIILGLIFYLVIFDFSRGALDKYLMFLIIPLVAISGDIIAGLFQKWRLEKDKMILFSPKILAGLAGILFVILIAINFLAHSVSALYPKTEWFSRIIHGNLNILTPFTGGSGPIGFYVSFLFIFVAFVVSLAFILLFLRNKKFGHFFLIVMIVTGVTYNLVFIEELSFAKINGSAPEVMRSTVSFIANNDQIKKVLTYNDIGARELSGIGKYAGRFYAAPQFEEGHRSKFAEFDGNYMIVGIPPIYQGFYSEFFSRCDSIFETQSVKITAVVYSCQIQK